jgi:3-oxoadipate enol-lactonase
MKVNAMRWREIRDTISGTTPQGSVGCMSAIQNFDYLEKLSTIRVPSLVICGDLDEGTPPDRNKLIASKIPGGKYEGIANARHLPNVERPEPFNRIMMGWLAANK